MKKVLIVESDQDVSLALSMRLRSRGYHPLLAFDAMMGVSMALREQPHLVILDTTLHGDEGFSVADRIRSSDSHDVANVPIIFLTESNQQSCLDKAKKYDVLCYFEKPYDAHALLSAIEETLAQIS